MTLKNLLGISLDEIEPDKAHIGKLLAAATRNIADAQIRALSPENRFDTAYKAIMQLAMVSLNANGYPVAKTLNSVERNAAARRTVHRAGAVIAVAKS